MIGVLSFRKNPSYLLRNNALRIALLTAANSALALSVSPPSWSWLYFLAPILLLSTAGILTSGAGFLLGAGTLAFTQGFEPLPLLYPVAALVVTFPVTSLYHSSSHEAMKPLWFNRLVGELCGLIHTSSIDEWSVIHSYHHRYADDPARDPHPPQGKGFVHFASTTGRDIQRSFFAHYFEAHGENDRTRRLLKATIFSIFVRQQLLTLFWFLALGPAAFVFFFGANIVLKKVHYAWFNWATHVEKEKVAEVLNQDSGLYWIVNKISFNLYYHKNHHLHPSLFNPKRIPEELTKEKTAGKAA